MSCWLLIYIVSIKSCSLVDINWKTSRFEIRFNHVLEIISIAVDKMFLFQSNV